MKRQTAQWVRKAEEELTGARNLAGLTPPLRDLACFHCQQAAEEYLKALLQELSIVIPRTHDLDSLVGLLIVHHPTLKKLRRRLDSLTDFAVEYRYPAGRWPALGKCAPLCGLRILSGAKSDRSLGCPDGK